MFDCIGTCRCKLVRGVVFVGRNQQSAAEAGAGLADRAAERVLVAAAPARRREARRAFVGLRPVRAVFVGGLHNAVETRFLGATVGVGNDGVGDGAVRAERADGCARLDAESWVGCVEVARFNT